MHDTTFWVTEFMSQARRWMGLHDETVLESLRKQYQARIDALTGAARFLIEEVYPKSLDEQITAIEDYCKPKLEREPEMVTGDYHKALVDQQKKIATHLMSLVSDLQTSEDKAIDIERLEQYVEQCTLQTLEFKNEHGTYELYNFHTQPTQWIVRFAPSWESLPTSFERRGIKTILVLTKRIYPDFYAWLVATFPKQGE